MNVSKREEKNNGKNILCLHLMFMRPLHVFAFCMKNHRLCTCIRMCRAICCIPFYAIKPYNIIAE